MRYVLLHHTAWPGKPDHYDLLIQIREGGENDRFLKAFYTESNVLPAPSQPGETRRESRLMAQADHRIAYLTYQGQVGAGRGRVVRVDEGECEHLIEPTREELRCRLTGKRLKGVYRMRLHAQAEWIMERVEGSVARQDRC
jgi:hypothetical protein